MEIWFASVFLSVQKSYALYFGLVTHIRYIVYGDECQRILSVDKIHQSLVFCLVYNGDNFSSLLHIIGSISFINSSTAMQFMKNELSEFFFFFGDNADAPFDVVVEDKMIKYNPIEIGTENP